MSIRYISRLAVVMSSWISEEECMAEQTLQRLPFQEQQRAFHAYGVGLTHALAWLCRVDDFDRNVQTSSG